MLNRLTHRVTSTLSTSPASAGPSAHPDDRMETRRSAPSPLLPESALQPPRGGVLSEEVVFMSFHNYARSAVVDAVWAGLMTRTQAKELDWEIMCAVPALTLLKAALESDSQHRIPVDKRGKVKLSLDTCPRSLRPMLQRWLALAPRIKAHRRDLKALRRYLADKGDGNAPREVAQLASEINGLAIEITQRRTYQQRAQATLQGAAEHVEADGYESEEEAVEGSSAPAASVERAAPGAEGADRPAPSAPPWPTPEPSAPPLPQSATGELAQASLEVTAAIPDSPALRAIREVLYSAVLDDLASDDGSLQTLVQADRARGISGITALAMLRVAKQMVTPDGQRIYLHEGEPLTRAACPQDLRALFDVITSRHAPVTGLTAAETRLLRGQLLGTGTPETASGQVLMLASLFSVFTAKVMGLAQHRAHMEEAFAVFGL